VLIIIGEGMTGESQPETEDLQSETVESQEEDVTEP